MILQQTVAALAGSTQQRVAMKGLSQFGRQQVHSEQQLQLQQQL